MVNTNPMENAIVPIPGTVIPNQYPNVNTPTPSNSNQTSDSNQNSPQPVDLGQFRLLENIPVIPVDWAMALLIIAALKKPEGREMLQAIAEKWLDSEARMVAALAQAGAGNVIVGWANSHLIAQILEQNYMIRKGGAKSLIDGMNWLTGATTLAELFGSLAVPATLVYSGAMGAEAGTMAKILGANK